MNKKEIFLKLILLLVAAFHILFGIAGGFFSDFSIKLFTYTFQANLLPTFTNLSYIKYLSAYAIGYGILAWLSSTDLKKYKSAINIIAIVLLLRLLQTIIFQEELINGFSLSIQSIFIMYSIKLILGASILFLNNYNFERDN